MACVGPQGRPVRSKAVVVAGCPNMVVRCRPAGDVFTASRSLRIAGASRVGFEQAEKQLRDCGVLDVSTRVDVGHPAQAIVDFVAAELGPEDVIVMGRRGLSNLPAVFLGSTSQKVAHLIDRTIVTVK